MIQTSIGSKPGHCNGWASGIFPKETFVCLKILHKILDVIRAKATGKVRGAAV